jgi:hypothetical protein
VILLRRESNEPLGVTARLGDVIIGELGKCWALLCALEPGYFAITYSNNLYGTYDPAKVIWSLRSFRLCLTTRKKDCEFSGAMDDIETRYADLLACWWCEQWLSVISEPRNACAVGAILTHKT